MTVWLTGRADSHLSQHLDGVLAHHRWAGSPRRGRGRELHGVPGRGDLAKHGERGLEGLQPRGRLGIGECRSHGSGGASRRGGIQVRRVDRRGRFGAGVLPHLVVVVVGPHPLQREVQHAHQDVLAARSPISGEQRGHHGLRRGHGGGLVENDLRGELGLPVRVALHVRQARKHLDDGIVDAPRRVRASGSEPTRTEINDVRVDLFYVLVADTHAIHSARAVVLQHDVTLGRNGHECGDALLALEVEDDGLFSSRRANQHTTHAAGGGGAEASRRVGVGERFNFDHLGPELGK
jgi:hypothetical protein